MNRLLPSLIFIPDISGFTRFVNQTEVSHGQHIIAELLEILIDSNELGLTLSEIEGDAVLFYKYQSVPGPEAVIKQAEKMFLNFHAHLKKYESQRICQCGACKTAFNLTLKIITHAGALDFMKIKDKKKPYGSDLILAHRLLKNNVVGKEYLLLSDQYLANQKDWQHPEWAEVEKGRIDYPNLEGITYQSLSLTPLHQSVPEIPIQPSAFTKQHPVVTKLHISKPRDEVFETVIDFEKRMYWNKVAKKIEFNEKQVNQVGAKHVCVFDGSTISFETVTKDFGSDFLVYGERVLEPPKIIKEMVLYFILAENGNGTNVQVEAHYELKPVIGFIMDPFIRRTLGKQNKKALQALKSWCEEQP